MNPMSLDQFAIQFLEILLGASIRAICLAIVVGVILLASRASAQMHHAAWTAVVSAMLLLPVVSLIMPAWRLPIEPAAALHIPSKEPAVPRVYSAKPIVIDMARRTMEAPGLRFTRAPLGWPSAAVVLYLAVTIAFFLRLAIGLVLTNRLIGRSAVLRDSDANDALAQIAVQQSAGYPLPRLLESDRVTVPCVISTDTPSILLPLEWRSWDAWKLQAVLAHELTHVRRRDWSFTVLAAINKGVFWFHPLSWWLETRLAALSEQASDDGSLLVTRDSARYATVLLEVSSSFAANGRRFLSGFMPAVPMASAHPVSRRIHRILDTRMDTRVPSSGVLQARAWLVLAACMIPFVCAIATAQAPSAELPPPAPPSPAQYLWVLEGQKVTAEQAQHLEQEVARNPSDLSARGKLIAYYQYNAMEDQVAQHVLWVIKHQPASNLASSTPVNSPYPAGGQNAYLAQKKALWMEQASAHPNDSRVLANAAEFLMRIDPPASERLLKRAIELDPSMHVWRSRLIALYADAIQSGIYVEYGVNLARQWPEANTAYFDKIRRNMEFSNDFTLVAGVGARMVNVLKHHKFRVNGQEYLTFEARRKVADYATRLLQRAQFDRSSAEQSSQALATLAEVLQDDAAIQENRPRPMSTNSARRVTFPQPTPSVARLQVKSSDQERRLIKRVQPLYPALARQTRILGIVRAHVVVGLDGTVTGMELSSGHPLLVPSAMEALAKWQYTPAYANGQPIEVETDVDINFDLERN